MNVKVIGTIIVSSVASYLLLTTVYNGHVSQKRIDFNEEGLLVEEKAGGFTVNSVNENFPTRLGSELKFSIGHNDNDTVSMKFVFPTMWNKQYYYDSLNAAKNFRDAIHNYFNDLTQKLSVQGSVSLTGVILNPFNVSDIMLTHIELGIQCKVDPKLRVTRILQCQVAAANIAKQISVNELLVYLNAYSAVGEVLDIGDETSEGKQREKYET